MGGVCHTVQIQIAAMLAGVQLAKMTPFRSYCVTTASIFTSNVTVGLGLYGGMTTYVNVRVRELLHTALSHATTALKQQLWVAHPVLP